MGVRSLHMDWLNLAVGRFRQYSATKANLSFGPIYCEIRLLVRGCLVRKFATDNR